MVEHRTWMPEAAELTVALYALGMRATTAGRAVRAWRPGNEAGSVWVVPRRSARDADLWWWRRGERSDFHVRVDVAGSAKAIAKFLTSV
jgi:hypothetical protein